MKPQNDALLTLYTSLVDSRNGYAQAVEDAGPDGMHRLFADMLDLRTKHIAELNGHLRASGADVDEGGSFMSTVHRAVISFQGLFGDLTERVLPGLIDGEGRILENYDNALHEARGHHAAWTSDLMRQRTEVAAAVARMEALRTAAAA